MGAGVQSQEELWESVELREVKGEGLATSAMITIVVTAVAMRQHRGLHVVKLRQHEAFLQRNRSNFGAFA